jgi:hypothetical protein
MVCIGMSSLVKDGKRSLLRGSRIVTAVPVAGLDATDGRLSRDALDAALRHADEPGGLGQGHDRSARPGSAGPPAGLEGR